MKRDIEFMKDRMNLPIGFDVPRNGYFYTEKVEHFPEIADERGGGVRACSWRARRSSSIGGRRFSGCWRRRSGG